MNLNQPVLMKAIGIGAAVGAVVGILRNIPIVSLGCCCLGWLVFLGVGAAYGYFDQKEGRPADMGQYVLGGAITGAVAGLVWGLVSGLVVLVMGLLGVTAAGTAAALGQLEQAGIDVPPELATQMAATSGAGVIGIFTGMCWGLIFYAILGALGGLAYMLIRGQSSQATPPAAV